MEEELSLRELLAVIWAGKRLIMIITLCAVMLSALFSFCLITPIYEAKTILAVNESNYPENKEGRGLEALLDTFARLPQVSVQSYFALAKSEPVIMKTMERLKLDTAKISLKEFAKKIKVRNIKDTELLELVVKDPSPQRAAEIANVLAEELSACGLVINKEKNRQNLALLEKQLQEEQVKLASYESEQKQFWEQPQSIVKLQAELDANLLLFSEFQARQANLGIETQKAALLIGELEKQGLTKELAAQKVLLSQLNIEKRLVAAEAEKSSKQIKSLQISLHDKKAELDRIQMSLEIAKENYVLVQKKLTESQITAALNFSEVTVTLIKSAFIPLEPVVPRTTLNLVVAAAFGLMLGVFVVIFRSYGLKVRG